MYKVIGVRDYDFVGKDGKRVVGAHIYVEVTPDQPLKGLTGKMCEDIRVNKDTLTYLIAQSKNDNLIGFEFQGFYYNKYENVEAFKL